MELYEIAPPSQPGSTLVLLKFSISRQGTNDGKVVYTFRTTKENEDPSRYPAFSIRLATGDEATLSEKAWQEAHISHRDEQELSTPLTSRPPGLLPLYGVSTSTIDHPIFYGWSMDAVDKIIDAADARGQSFQDLIFDGVLLDPLDGKFGRDQSGDQANPEALHNLTDATKRDVRVQLSEGTFQGTCEVYCLFRKFRIDSDTLIIDYKQTASDHQYIKTDLRTVANRGKTLVCDESKIPEALCRLNTCIQQHAMISRCRVISRH